MSVPVMSDGPVVLDVRVVTGTGGGPDKTILNSPRYLNAAGYRMLCAYMHPPKDPGFEQIRRNAAALRAPLLPVPDRGPWDWNVALQLLKICRQERVTIWHGHDYKSNALGLLLRRFWRMRLITTVHGWGVAGARPLYHRIDRLCLPYYELVFCVSDELHEQCLACGVREERCVLLENGIDTAMFSRRVDLEKAKARLGIPPHRFVIGAVGRLSREKGFDILIQSVDQLLKDGFDVELLIVGEGDDRPRIETQISELGRTPRVHLLGYRSDTREIYEAMDVFALSSLSEGLPNVLLEAMALEVPVVATRVGGIPKIIQNDVNGLIVESGSPGALRGAIARLLSDNPFRARLRRAGRATVELTYSFEARMLKLQEIYNALLEEHQPVRHLIATTNH